MFGLPAIISATPLPERHLNPLQDDIVDFAPLSKGRLPEALVQALGQVNAGVNDSGPGCRPWGFAGALAARGGVRVRLGMNRSPTGFLGRSTALRGREGTGTTPRRCSVTALPLTYFPRRHN